MGSAAFNQVVKTTVLIGAESQRAYWPIWLRERDRVGNHVVLVSSNFEDVVGCLFEAGFYLDPAYLSGEREEYPMVTNLRLLLLKSDMVCIVAVDGREKDADLAAHVALLANLRPAVTLLIAISHWDRAMPSSLRHLVDKGTVNGLVRITNKDDLSHDEMQDHISPTGRRLREFLGFVDGLLYGPSHNAIGFEDIQAMLRASGALRFATATFSPPERISRCLASIETKLRRKKSIAASAAAVSIEAAPCGLQAGDVREVMKQVHAWSVVQPEATLICNTGYDGTLKLSQVRISILLTGT